MGRLSIADFVINESLTIGNWQSATPFTMPFTDLTEEESQ
jgi:hypothetical protein